MDVESLQKSGRRRGSCLDAFLIMSIIFLFVAVTAVAAGGLLAVMDLRSKLQPQKYESQTSQLTGHAPDPKYKMQNFVYLSAIRSELMHNTTMEWASVHYADGASIGSNFVFDSEQHTLMAEAVGTYFMYIDLTFTCVYKCKAGVFSIRVGDKFTCDVRLPAVNSSTPVTKKCWTVSQMNKEKLLTEMTVPKEGLENWRLEPNSSGFGMFLVD
ncbi:uncharacterized protein LOC108885466 [Lates calcarifer]|uniref:Uncharacterized protein LOC108885466 n=1 Tax=Lates calcarifer TaxID=8187 RepID=A0AAJ7PPS5_LATCA|nr:uncharacterized protein LOC108885466 [Lates calcarifer]